MTMRIETERLIIMELTLDMAAEIQRQSQDEDTRRFVPDEVFDTLEEARKTVRELMAVYQSQDGPYVYAVVRKDGNLLGYVQLCRVDDGWEIGYHIAAEQTGRGYATEAVCAFLPVMMDRLALERVWGIVDERNTASCRVLEKCGFTLIERGEGPYHGRICPRRRYRLIRTE